MVLELIQDFIISNPATASVLSCIGAFRVLFKPVLSLAKFLSSKTKTTRDDEFIEKLEKSKAYQIIRYCFDWFASIKLPATKK